eukprot:CAMPEP_0182498582 /NCGR_PEP_ID=MMETSP1321-20130603/6747_1 /TAXON_ID=91990 /ORGANISM="Bolidomonas sp., Strain RCC1657" /LENGTH=33 /DNA_ID= /DNA_START= /DNA_END= /DNA_ORIENTATION=
MPSNSFTTSLSFDTSIFIDLVFKLVERSENVDA